MSSYIVAILILFLMSCGIAGLGIVGFNILPVAICIFFTLLVVILGYCFYLSNKAKG